MTKKWNFIVFANDIQDKLGNSQAAPKMEAIIKPGYGKKMDLDLRLTRNRARPRTISMARKSGTTTPGESTSPSHLDTAAFLFKIVGLAERDFHLRLTGLFNTLR